MNDCIVYEGASVTPVGIQWTGEMDFETYEDIGVKLSLANKALNWCIGDWLAYGENRPDWNDRYEQAVGMFGKDLQTLRNLASVAKKFPLVERNPRLDWSHHEAVRSLPEETRRELLEEAEPLADGESPMLTVRDLKAKVKEIQAREEAESSATPSRWLENLADAGHHFQTILADPDWTVGAAELAKLPISALADEKCALFLWCPDTYLLKAQIVFDGWGMFNFKKTLVWIDGSRHHLLLCASQGGAKPDTSAFEQTHYNCQPITGEKKPAVFREFIEETNPGPRLELWTGDYLHEGWVGFKRTCAGMSDE